MSKLKHLDYDKIFKGLKSAISEAYYPLKSRGVKEIKWEGPLLTTFRVLAGQFNTDEALGEYFEGSLQRGRDAMDIILNEAFKFGQECAYRTLAIEGPQRAAVFRIVKKGLENPTEYNRKSALEFLGIMKKGYENPGGVK